MFHDVACAYLISCLAASRRIQSVASAMRIPEAVATAAVRTYTLAVEHKFTKGRKSLQVVGVCLYVACRQQTTQNRFMLIDFADMLQARTPFPDHFSVDMLNVYVCFLGQCL
jgi:transcription initiation factor TFIIIB Brf1 subunit/transcription initiation factor TFIIB